MSQYFRYASDPDSSPPYGQHYTWREVWTKVIMQPSQETFEDILADPEASAGRAYRWIVGTAIAYYLLLIALTICALSANSIPFNLGGLLINTVVVGIPITVIVAVIAFTVNVGLTQLIARILGGRATFGDLAYALASVNAPMVFLTFALSFVLSFCLASAGLGGTSLIDLVSLALGIYSLALQTIALKVSQKFSWGAAIGTMIILIVIITLVVVAILSALGPPIDNIFQDIIENLQ